MSVSYQTALVLSSNTAKKREGGETPGLRSFLVRVLLTALPDDIIRAAGWLSRQIAAQASLTNTVPSLVNVKPKSINIPAAF